MLRRGCRDDKLHFEQIFGVQPTIPSSCLTHTCEHLFHNSNSYSLFCCSNFLIFLDNSITSLSISFLAFIKSSAFLNSTNQS